MTFDAALIVQNLTKSYAGRRVVDDVSFSAPAGAITAVLGPNGAGKTTSIECAAGLRSPDGGTITVLGRDRADPANAAYLRRRVGVMVQEGGLPQAPAAGAVLAHVAALHGAPGRLEALAADVDLTDSLATPVRRLSGGQRQRLAVACALAGNPDLAFLDEPTSGVDPQSRRRMWQLLRERRERGTALVVTTHLMAEAEANADRIVVLDGGRVAADGTPAELTAGTLVRIDAPAPDVAAVAHAIGARLVDAGGDRALEVDRADANLLARLSAALIERGAGACTIDVRPRSLEAVFLAMTRSKEDR